MIPVHTTPQPKITIRFSVGPDCRQNHSRAARSGDGRWAVWPRVTVRSCDMPAGLLVVLRLFPTMLTGWLRIKRKTLSDVGSRGIVPKMWQVAPCAS